MISRIIIEKVSKLSKEGFPDQLEWEKEKLKDQNSSEMKRKMFVWRPSNSLSFDFLDFQLEKKIERISSQLNPPWKRKKSFQEFAHVAFISSFGTITNISICMRNWKKKLLDYFLNASLELKCCYHRYCRNDERKGKSHHFYSTTHRLTSVPPLGMDFRKSRENPSEIPSMMNSTKLKPIK